MATEEVTRVAGRAEGVSEVVAREVGPVTSGRWRSFSEWADWGPRRVSGSGMKRGKMGMFPNVSTL